MNWDKIYTDSRPVMLEAALRRVRDRPDVEAEDVVHEVFPRGTQ